MAIPVSEDTVCGSMYSQNQCQVPSCLQQWCQLQPTELHLGSSLVPICLCNLSAHSVKTPQRLWLARSCLPPKCHWWSPQQGLQGSPNSHPQKEWVLEALDLQGLGEWAEPEQEQARELLLKWEHLFACSDLDLGKTALIKHKIEVTDWMPFKEHY